MRDLPRDRLRRRQARARSDRRSAQVRAERDLLESIIYPSASFVRSYEPVSVATKDGKVVSGLLRKDAPDEVVVAVAADREERDRPRSESRRSPHEAPSPSCPPGLDQPEYTRGLADLIAFLAVPLISVSSPSLKEPLHMLIRIRIDDAAWPDLAADLTARRWPRVARRFDGPRDAGLCRHLLRAEGQELPAGVRPWPLRGALTPKGVAAEDA